MGTIDIILLICFVPAIWRGLTRGFIEQAVAIAAIVAGVWLAFRFSGVVGDWLSTYVEAEGSVIHAISFAVVVLVVLVVLNLLGRLLTGIVKLAMLGWLNKLLGIVFAILKTVLLLGLAITVLDSVNAQWGLIRPEELDGSVLYTGIRNFCLRVFPYLKGLLPNA